MLLQAVGTGLLQGPPALLWKTHTGHPPGSRQHWAGHPPHLLAGSLDFRRLWLHPRWPRLGKQAHEIGDWRTWGSGQRGVTLSWHADTCPELWGTGELLVRNEALEGGSLGCFKVPPGEGSEPLPARPGASGRPRDWHLGLGTVQF